MPSEWGACDGSVPRIHSRADLVRIRSGHQGVARMHDGVGLVRSHKGVLVVAHIRTHAALVRIRSRRNGVVAVVRIHRYVVLVHSRKEALPVVRTRSRVALVRMALALVRIHNRNEAARDRIHTRSPILRRRRLLHIRNRNWVLCTRLSQIHSHRRAPRRRPI